MELPHAAALCVVYVLVRRLTKHSLAGWFSVAILAGNYLFFLYSVTPEVFAFLDLFTVVLFALATSFTGRFRYSRWYLLCLVLGLAIAHHPFIVLMIPSLGILLLPYRRKLRMRQVLGGIVAGGTGFLPYLYVAVAARGTSVVNWDRATDISRFMRLVTRADYGSFMSGSTVGHSLLERLLNVKIYTVFTVTDFTWAGLLLACAGIIWLWRRNRRVCIALCTGVFLTGPAFAFYASFPTINRFVLGTVERFVLPGYMLLSIACGIGAYAVSTVITSVIRRVIRQPVRKVNTVFLLFFSVLFLYPVTVGSMNAWRFAGIGTDMTTDNFARDVLDSTPEGSVLLLTRDTPLFGVQYMRLALRYRQDVYVIHAARLPFVDYHETLKAAYPGLAFPPDDTDPGRYAEAFIRANSAVRTVATNSPIALGGDGTWLPHGLVYVFDPAEGEVTAEQMAANETRWLAFHDPNAGLLSRYHHLFLTNVLDEYAISANEYGMYLLRHEHITEASGMFERAVAYGSDTQTATAYMYAGLSYSLEHACEKAFDAYDRAAQPGYGENTVLLYYRAVTWRDCVGDEVRAQELFDAYRAAEAADAVPLEHPR